VTRPEPSVVLKLGGETLAAQHATLAALPGIVAEHRLVLVHGGGKRLTEWLARLGIESRFVDGRRVTDDAALEVAVAVLGGLVNRELVAALAELGVRAAGIAGFDGGLLRAGGIPALGRVGRITATNPAVLHALLDAGILPVVAPLAIDETGAICNVNADEVAAAIAGAMRGRLLLLSDTDGVRGADGRRIEGGVISGGMVPKVLGALDVLRAGGCEVVIADGRGIGAIRRAIEDPDAGTRVVRTEDRA
jgi:acetylglutamate kinase